MNKGWLISAFVEKLPQYSCLIITNLIKIVMAINYFAAFLQSGQN